jgi:hypothetical protein
MIQHIDRRGSYTQQQPAPLSREKSEHTMCCLTDGVRRYERGHSDRELHCGRMVDDVTLITLTKVVSGVDLKNYGNIGGSDPAPQDLPL